MGFFRDLFRKNENAESYDPAKLKPVIRSSICTGEKTACMQDLKTGHLTELMLIKSEADIDAFCEEYGVRREDIATVY